MLAERLEVTSAQGGGSMAQVTKRPSSPAAERTAVGGHPPPAAVMTIAGWERSSSEVVLGALRLAALSIDADVCCLVWQPQGDAPIAVFDLGAVEATAEDRASWLALACSLPPGAGARRAASGGVLVAPVRGPGGAVEGALALRPAAGAAGPDGRHEGLAFAAAAQLSLVLASSAAHTQRATAYEALFEIGTQIQAEEANADAIFALIVDRARALLLTDVAWLAMVDRDRQRLGMKVAVGAATPDFMGMEVQVGTGIGGVALKERRPVAVRDSRVYGHGMPRSVHRALDEEGVISILCAPMLRDDGMLGALYVGTRKARDFTEEEASLLSALAAQAAVTIENARLYQELSDKNDMLERAFAIHRSLTDASLAGVGLHRVALELARLIDRDLLLVLDDGATRCTRYSRDAAVDAPVAAGLDEVDVPDGQNAVDITAGDTELGGLHALGDGELTALQRKALEHGATAIALELVKEQATLEVEWRLQGELLEELLRSSGAPSEDLARRAERLGVDLAGQHRIAVLAPDRDVASSSLLELVRRWLRQHGHLDRLVAQRGDRVVVAVGADLPGGGKPLIEDLQRRVTRAGVPVRCGVSNARTELTMALREAEGALALAISTGRPDAIVDYEALGPLRFLLDAPDTTEMTALVRDVLGPLAAHDAQRHSDLLLTLKTYLESGGHHPTTSERCHIHVSTLKYRLSRISALLERSLSDPATRFELSLAFEVLGILEVMGIAPFRSDGPDPASTRRAEPA
jgi:GAF domain-containing protein/sugar diacid utilization regulator